MKSKPKEQSIVLGSISAIGVFKKRRIIQNKIKK